MKKYRLIKDSSGSLFTIESWWEVDNIITFVPRWQTTGIIFFNENEANKFLDKMIDSYYNPTPVPVPVVLREITLE